MKTRKRIAIVYPYRDLDSVPSLYNMAVLLAEHGYWVDIFTRLDDAYVKPTFTHDRIAVLPVDLPPASEWPALLRLLPGPILTRIYGPAHWLARHLQTPYVCVIGVDPRGLVKAQSITRWVKAPLAYYSLELLLSHELITERDRELKAQERALSQQAAFVIIQDEERAALLVKDNGLAPDRIITVPNAPLGPASDQRSDYLRRKFGLSAHTTVILSTGSLGAWVCSHQLMRSTLDWPDDWVLICHTRYPATTLNRNYIEALQYLAKQDRVIFSTEPVPQHEYPSLVQSADVGVAFYCVQPGSTYTQDNIRHIGLSSGKVAYYLQAGLPIIVNRVSSLEHLVASYQCGEVTTDPAETRPVIERILSDYEAYSRNALTCFDREFDFASKFGRVLVALEQL